MNKIIADRYEIIDLIGQGGMADVYLAKDEILNRTIAIKILRTSLAKDPVYITRFQREASAAAALSNKNIVEIYDVGEDNNQYYIVMEYVPGTTLKELIRKRGALHYVEAIDIMKQVVSGMVKAHQLGIIHRDLKPQNILVTDAGTAKIADFGIASMQSLAQVTQTDVIMGSLHYLAPELARGEKASAQSDIYALGIVMYELLRGEVPFNGESPVNIALKHMQEDLPSLLKFNPTIPQSVENVVIKATAKNLADRYQSASEMLEDLNICLYNPDVEKIVFDTPIDQDPTIVIDPTKVFDTDETPSYSHTQTQQVVPPKKEGFMEKLASLSTGAKVGIGVAVVAVVAIIFAFAFLSGGSDTSLMPDLVGKTQAEAKDILGDYDVSINKTVYSELSDKYEKGQIISTDPEEGKTIKSGSVVTLTVSKGKYIVVEEYVGMTSEEAKKDLEALGFTVQIEEVVSSEKKDTVVKQSLDKGYKQDPTVKHPSITLQVSKGDYVVVGDYVGLNYDTALSKLNDLGFKVTKKEVSSEEASGTVTDQSLPSGYKIDPTETTKSITLTVSTGYTQKVPSVVGMNVDNAKSTLQDLGFNVETKEMTSTTDVDDPDSIEAYVVVKQTPAASSSVTKKGTTVTISYFATVPTSTTNNGG